MSNDDRLGINCLSGGSEMRFIIIIFFFLICRLYQTRDIDCEDREHHHAESSQQDRQDASCRGDRDDVRTYGRHVHESPPESVTVILDFGVHFLFDHEKDQAGEIDHCQQHRQVGDEEAGSPVRSQPADDDRQCPSAAYERDETQELGHLGRESKAIVIYYIKIRNRNQQEEKMGLQIMNFIF